MKRNLNTLKKLIKQIKADKHRRLPKDQILELINEVFFFDCKTEKRLMLRRETQTKEYVNVKVIERHYASRTYQPGATFIRVRKVNQLLATPSEKDFWEAPADSTLQGRTNQAREPLLYVTCDVGTALLETHTNETDTHYLNLYRVKSAIEVTEIGFSIRNIAGSKNSIRRTIQEFITELFSKKGASAYDISNFLAKRFYDFDNDGWVYPSVANPSIGENLGINQLGKSKLELIASFAFSNQCIVASYRVTPSGKVIASDQNDAVIHWNTILKDPKVFGNMNQVQPVEERYAYLEKLIPEL